MQNIKRFLALGLVICVMMGFSVFADMAVVKASEGDFPLATAYQMNSSDSNVIYYTFDVDVNQSGAMGYVQIVNGDMSEVIKTADGIELSWDAWADAVIGGNTLASYELKSATLGISALQDIFALVNEPTSEYYGKGYKVVYTLSPHDDESLNNGIIDKYAAADNSGCLLAPYTYGNKEAARVELLPWEMMEDTIDNVADAEGNFSISSAFQTNNADSNEIYYTFDVAVNQSGALGLVQIVNSDMTEVIKTDDGVELSWDAWADAIINSNTLASYELKSDTLGVSTLKEVFALVNDPTSDYSGKGYKVVYTLSPHDDEPLHNGIIDKYAAADNTGYLLAPFTYNNKEAARIELLTWEEATEIINNSIDDFDYGTIFSIEKNENIASETDDDSVNIIVWIAAGIALAVIIFFVVKIIVRKAGKKA